MRIWISATLVAIWASEWRRFLSRCWSRGSWIPMVFHPFWFWHKKNCIIPSFNFFYILNLWKTKCQEIMKMQGLAQSCWGYNLQGQQGRDFFITLMFCLKLDQPLLGLFYIGFYFMSTCTNHNFFATVLWYIITTQKMLSLKQD